MSTRSGAGRHGTDRPSSRCWATRADRIRAPTVAEAAVVGASDPATGKPIAAFVILRSEAGDVGPDVVQELRNHGTKEIGPIAKPRRITVVAELPKARSGKIMRHLLRDVAENRETGDVTTLAGSTVMDLIKSNLESGKTDED